jgi:hypothetical protein
MDIEDGIDDLLYCIQVFVQVSLTSHAHILLSCWYRVLHIIV